MTGGVPAADAAGRAVLPPAPRQAHARVDAVSGLLTTGGLAAIVYACSQAVPHGWTSARVLVAGTVGLAAIAAFAVRQMRTAAPLLPPYVLADRARLGADLAVAASVIGIFGIAVRGSTLCGARIQVIRLVGVLGIRPAMKLRAAK